MYHNKAFDVIENQTDRKGMFGVWFDYENGRERDYIWTFLDIIRRE